jgi:hypothetical protein
VPQGAQPRWFSFEQAGGAWSDWDWTGTDEYAYVDQPGGSTVTLKVRSVDRVGNASPAAQTTVTVSGGPPAERATAPYCGGNAPSHDVGVLCLTGDGSPMTTEPRPPPASPPSRRAWLP